MTIEHRLIPEAQLHEPKGVSTAAVDTVYVADGAGSGNWGESPNHVPKATGQLKGQLLVANGLNAASWALPVWKDLTGDVTPKTSGVGAPTLTTFRGNIRSFAYAVAEDGDASFHLPHDYVPGSDMYLHLHWAHNGTNITGTFTTNCYVTYAKGHNQEAFFSEITIPISATSLTLANTPQYQHRIEEVQLTSATPSASQFNSSLIEPDGLILLHFDVATIPTITGGSAKPFIFFVDLHYQASMLGTANKVPNFYS